MSSNNNSEMVEEVDDDLDLETLESDSNQMAQKLLEYRATLPDHLNNTLVSLLAAHRPRLVPFHAEQNIFRGDSSSASEDPHIAKKVKLLNEKISSNCSAMPIVLKNMKECIAKINKLDSYNEIIHPAFRRKSSG
ncbi:hypothetical protein RIF29_27336 [Crotalaria pallida]|uniref:Uncharacterized protein n=1 Tax=Crotalaria pallida TaxID=3830 RepID=A0AAN9EW38_CROPI